MFQREREEFGVDIEAWKINGKPQLLALARRICARVAPRRWSWLARDWPGNPISARASVSTRSSAATRSGWS